MLGYASIKKALGGDRQQRAASQDISARSDSSNEASQETSTDERDAARDTLSSALKSLFAYRNKKRRQSKAEPYQGAGDEYEEGFKASDDDDGVVIARGLDEVDSDYRQLFLESLNYAIDMLNIAISQLRMAEPGGRIEQSINKVFDLEGEGLDDILHFRDMARLLENNFSVIRDALIDFGGVRRNQILFSDNMSSTATVHPTDPHRRLHIGIGFFDEITYKRAHILIHEVSHQVLETEDYWYNADVKSEKIPSRYYRRSSDLEGLIETQRQIVNGLSDAHLVRREEFAEDMGLGNPEGEPDYARAIELFHNDLSEKMDAYINNADSVAGLVPIIAGPDLVALSNKGVYKKGQGN